MVLVIAFSVISVLGARQAPQASGPLALVQLEGRWTGAGQVNGGSIKAELHVEPVLAGRFVRIRYRFDDPRTGGGVFEGHAYYRDCLKAVACGGQWFDSQGSSHVLSAVHGPLALTAEWGDGVVARGKTEYRVNGGAGLVVTDWVRTADGGWRQFGSVTYERAR